MVLRLSRWVGGMWKSQGLGCCKQSIKVDSGVSAEDQATDSPGNGEGSACQTSEGTDCQQWAQKPLILYSDKESDYILPKP